MWGVSRPIFFIKIRLEMAVKKIFILILSFFSLSFLEGKNLANKPKVFIKDFVLSSPVFENNSNIPSEYTCDGKNISPELNWENAPENTKSFALIVDDPDAMQVAGKVWVHWVVYNIPANIKSLSENIKSGDFEFGKTDFDGKKQWGGPCPPSGNHKYIFTLYALDNKLDLTGEVNKEKLLKAMKSHIISQTQLIGLYERKK